MSIRTIRNLLLIAVLAFTFNGKNQSAGVSGFSNCPMGSILEQSDANVGTAEKYHAHTQEFETCILANLNAPVQESTLLARRVEYSRSEEPAGSVNAAAIITSIPARRIHNVAINDRHCTTALCHNSRYYIYKFGALLI